MFIRNDWYIAAWASELGSQSGARPLGRKILNEDVVLFRDREGKVAALENRCAHRGVPLSCGEIVDKGIQCGYHGLIFNRTGACVEVPGQTVIPPRAKIRSYPLVEKDRFCWIWMGDPAKADPSTILDYPYHDDSKNWPHKHDMYPIKCNYTLLIDNLMDLTHLGFVHRKTIGGNAKVHVDARMETTRKDNGLHYIRWMLESTPPPTYSKSVKFGKDKVDRWQEFELFVPGAIVQWSGATDAGTGACEGKRDGGFSLRLFHGITPETDKSCFYFWSAANGYRQDDPAATEQLFDEIAVTFKEDWLILEEQQASLDRYPERNYVEIAADGARVHARKVIDRRLAEEAAEAKKIAEPVMA